MGVARFTNCFEIQRWPWKRLIPPQYSILNKSKNSQRLNTECLCTCSVWGPLIGSPWSQREKHVKRKFQEQQGLVNLEVRKGYFSKHESCANLNLSNTLGRISLPSLSVSGIHTEVSKVGIEWSLSSRCALHISASSCTIILPYWDTALYSKLAKLKRCSGWGSFV